METRRQQQKGNCGSGVMAVRLPERAQKGNRCGLANDLCNSPICTRSANATHKSKAQRETIGRVMHEFKHGELQTSAGRQVKNPKQAIAIGLHEAGASKYESESKEQSRRNLKRTKARERRGATGKRRSERHDDGKTTRAELYAEARRQNLPGRSKMSKRQLQSALR